MNLIKDTPFDQYSRQKIVAESLDSIRNKNEKFSILDVGGYKGKTDQFQPKDSVTVCDLFSVKEKNYVQIDGKTLPFENGAFDFVVSFDALEHVNANHRVRFMEECLRVAGRGVIICAPHLNIKNKTAEIKLNQLYKTLSDDDHRWLKEHIEYGLPNFLPLIKKANTKKYHTASLFSNDIQSWMLMQSALFTNEKYPSMASKLVALNERFNLNFSTDLRLDPGSSYRQILFAFKNEKDINKVKGISGLESKNQQVHEIDFIYSIVDYYASLIIHNDEVTKLKIQELQGELEKLNAEIERIKSSKSWHYAQKISHAKNKLLK